jgi:hypothetical protein
MAERELSILGLQGDTVSRIAQATDNHARGMRDDSVGSVTNLALAASAFTAAGSYWSLIDLPRARDAFRAATALHWRLGHTFAAITAICASTKRELREEVREPLVSEGEGRAEQLVYQALFQLCRTELGLSPAESLIDRSESLLGIRQDPRPMGRLGIPVGQYVEFATTAIEAAQGSNFARRAFRRTTAAFYRRADEPVRFAMGDSFHWKRLLSTFLPVEPELLAVGVVYALVSRRLGLRTPDLTESGPAGSALTLGAAVAAQAESSDDPGFDR